MAVAKGLLARYDDTEVLYVGDKGRDGTRMFGERSCFSGNIR
jgi:hypothetical protein